MYATATSLASSSKRARIWRLPIATLPTCESLRRVVISFTCLVVSACSLEPGAAAPVLVPSGLNPGDTYHLAFVSSTKRDAISTNIADYDAHVQAAANAAGGGLQNFTWKAIGSTAAVDAIDHIDVQGPIYRLDDTLIAISEADLFDTMLAAPLELTEVETTLSSFNSQYVWTGSFGSGVGVAMFELGGTAGAIFGEPDATNQEWLHFLGSALLADPKHIYGITELLTVPVPEPHAAILFTCGAVLVGVSACVRRRRRVKPQRYISQLHRIDITQVQSHE